MTARDRNPSSTPESSTADTWGQRTARLIEDPVGSVVAGVVAPAAAVGVVVSAIYGLGLIY